MPFLPFVSVLTPTCNRRRFIPALIECFRHQDYPMDRVEWIILDDGDDKVGDLFEGSGLEVRYFSETTKLAIGAKRNRLNELAKGEIIVCMDDDDYYPPERISHVVDKLAANPEFSLCGSSELYIFYSDNQTIYRSGPYHPNHATNGTMAYRRSYLENHAYDATAKKAEESVFLNQYTEPMLQLDSFKVVLLMSHSGNTFDKRTIREQNSPVFRLTQFDLNRFIKNERLAEFYRTA